MCIKIQETGLIHSSLLQYSTTSLKSHKKVDSGTVVVLTMVIKT